MIEVELAHPMALLDLITKASEESGRFLSNVLAGGVGKVVLHLDETRPGNQLRPDSGRTTQCIFSTLQEMPQ